MNEDDPILDQVNEVLEKNGVPHDGFILIPVKRAGNVSASTLWFHGDDFSKRNIVPTLAAQLGNKFEKILKEIHDPKQRDDLRIQVANRLGKSFIPETSIIVPEQP